MKRVAILSVLLTLSGSALSGSLSLLGAGGVGGGGGGWTPASLGAGLALWLEPADITTLFQTIDCSTTAVSANADPVGCIKDKSGNGFNLSAAANDGTRPVYTTGTSNYVAFNGTNSFLFRTGGSGLDLYGSAAQYSIWVCVRSNSTAAGAILVAESNSGATNQFVKT